MLILVVIICGSTLQDYLELHRSSAMIKKSGFRSDVALHNDY